VIGMEANPQDIREGKTSGLIEAGITELSIGVQSFHKKNLKILGRANSIEDSLEAVKKCP